jgi:phosphoenolpyruvate-protein kinase (PTS system EI component)
MAERLHEGEIIFRGIPVSAGICRGKLLVLDKSHHTLSQHTLSEAEVAEELSRLERALIQTRQQ